MNKKLLAALAIASLSVTVTSATAPTQLNKGEFQLDAGAYNVKAESANVESDGGKLNFDGGLTYGLTDKTALQYHYTGLKVNDADDSEDSLSNHMHEVNLVQSLNKNVSVYGGWANIDGDVFERVGSSSNNIAQLGVIAKAPLGDRVEAYAKGSLGTKSTSMWEAGLGVKLTKDLDLNGGYKYINTKLNDDHNVSFKGWTAGLSYRFGEHHEEAYVAPVVITETEEETPVVENPRANNDYYVQSIHFNSDQDVPRADPGSNLDAMVTAAKAYPNSKIKLTGNTDSDANAEYNQALSERRVRNVAQYAVDHGVSADRLVGIANGEAKPASSNDTEQGKADNRRVDVWVNR